VTATETDRNPTARAAVAAGVLFVDEAGKIMMVRPTYKPFWDIPGGYVEPNETPSAAASREVAEELGVHVEVGQLLSVDWAPNADEGNKILFVFDGGSLTTDEVESIRLADGELAEYKFIGVEELDQVTIPRLARRLRATCVARSSRTPVYLESGERAR
jgi:ADP-ribose pyrophosphatase YjhB (NUDIX family)